MRLRSPLSLVVILALLLPARGMPAQVRDQPVTPTPAASHHARVAAALQSAAVMFIENTGQFPDGARFQVRRGDRTFWLTEDALWVTVRGVNIKLSFGGANPHPRPEPFNRLNTRISYFIGSDPTQWRPDVPVWGGVRYVDLYPGMDLEIAGENNQMVQRLVVHSSADWRAARLQVDGSAPASR